MVGKRTLRVPHVKWQLTWHLVLEMHPRVSSCEQNLYCRRWASFNCQISMYFLEVGTECSIATDMNFGQHPGKGRINNPVSPSICDIKSPTEVDKRLTAAELTAHNNGQSMACWVQLKFTIINKTKLIKIINSTVMEISIIKIFTYGPELGWSRRKVGVSNVTVGYLRMLQTVGVSRQQRHTESRGTLSLHPLSLHRR